MQQYVKELQRLSERLTCALAEALDMAPDHFNRFFEPDPHIRMKVVQYPPRTSVPDPEGFGVGPHKGEMYTWGRSEKKGAECLAANVPDFPLAVTIYSFSPLFLLPDYGFFGFLLQDDVGGLQVQNADGEWLDVTPLDNTFVVSLGEMLEVATAGAFTATTHRVLVPQSTRV